ncbi:MAG: acetylxylan esterase [Planctomycetales bacterium]|nr:acetylxylan esterase [Planctomycetales bacterium]
MNEPFLFKLCSQFICSLIAIFALASPQVRADEPWQANPDTVARLTKQRSEFNYDEAKVPAYTLPDPLVKSDGSKVTDADDWNQTRRAELMELFRSQVYGRRPTTPYTIRFDKTAEIDDAFDGLAVGRSMSAVITVGSRSYAFPFVVFVPKKENQKVPAIVHINNRNFISLKTATTEHDPFWPVKSIVERGYATASFHTSDVDPDDKTRYADGVRSFFADGKPPPDDAWRSLSAWGWAASRVLDHLETLDVVDATQAAVVGHSRGGKTALWAACEDTRFAIAYSNNSGCGGAALSRRALGETVGRITEVFPHWFCKNFADYTGREKHLPVDQHEVMALIAPRSIYVTSADEDLWADPRGEYLSLVSASPVFRLLGIDSIADESMPAVNQPRVVGHTGYHIRSGAHNLGEQDWKWFLNFADTIVKQ